MKNQAKDSLENATARPWSYSKHYDRIKKGYTYSIDQFSQDAILPDQEANAALIVRAVNSHDALVEALKKCAFALETIAHLQGREKDLLPITDNARNALKIAKGE